MCVYMCLFVKYLLFCLSSTYWKWPKTLGTIWRTGVRVHLFVHVPNLQASLLLARHTCKMLD